MILGVVGVGVVGHAVYSALKTRLPHRVLAYDTNGQYDALVSLSACDAIFLCLPTPTKNGIQDQTALQDTLWKLASFGFKGVAVIKSTVLPGTTQELSKKVPFPIVHNPEFLSARTADQDFLQQKSILLGSADVNALSLVTSIYRELFPSSRILCFGNPSETEMLKYMNNVFFAVKVGVFNEFYQLCDRLGLSYDRVRLGALEGTDWIGEQHTAVPGPDGKPGWGGMCFPKDVSALLHHAQNLGLSLPIVKAALEENRQLRPDVEDKI